MNDEIAGGLPPKAKRTEESDTATAAGLAVTSSDMPNCSEQNQQIQENQQPRKHKKESDRGKGGGKTTKTQKHKEANAKNAAKMKQQQAAKSTKNKDLDSTHGPYLHEYVQLIGTDVPDATSGALVFTEESRVAFNTPEGMQRYAGEAKIRLPKLSALFFTRVSVHTMMGFPGLLFTVNDVGVKALDIGGPTKQLATFWETTKEYFFTYRTMAVNIFEPKKCSDGSLCANEVVFVWKQGGLNVQMLRTGNEVFSYVCSSRTESVKFDPETAKALGVKPGPKYAELKRGNAVESDKEPGVMIQPEQVLKSCGLGSNGSGVTGGSLILDVDGAEGIPMDIIKGKVKDVPPVHTIVHLSPKHVMETDAFKTALEEIKAALPNIRHVFGRCPHEQDEGARPQSAFPTAFVQRLHLHQIQPDSFPMPQQQLLTEEEGATKKEAGEEDTWRYGARYSLLNGEESKRDTFPYPTIQSAAKMLSQGFFDKLNSEKSTPTMPALAESAKKIDPNKPQVNISFLGTGSAIPSKYRNVSCIFLEIAAREAIGMDQFNILCDCGEGSLGQLLNMFGPDGLRRAVLNTRMAIVTHAHADHHLGLLAFLDFRAQLHKAQCLVNQQNKQQPLVLVLSADVYDYLRRLSNIFSSVPGAPSTYITLEEMVEKGYLLVDQLPVMSQPQTSFNGGVSKTILKHASTLAHQLQFQLAVFPVDHPASAYSFATLIKGKTANFSVCCSGDTRPGPVIPSGVRQLLSSAGCSENLDLLVHEATFADGMEHEATAKKHSTLGEALSVGQACGATFTMLTHFSQRYPKVLPSTPLESSQPYSVAFDLMRTHFGGSSPSAATNSVGGISDADNERLVQMMPVFQALLEEYEAWGEGTSKRLRDR